MPSKEPDDTRIVSVRLPATLVQRLDRLLDWRATHQRVKSTRNAALRELEANGQDVIVDAGRLGLAGSPQQLLDSADATLLSDELSIVRIAEGHAMCFGTPFRGELALAGEDRAVPLVGIYFLHHGSRHAVQTLRPGQALARLLPNVLFFAREADLTAEVFRIAADLVEALPCFDLSFRPDPGFWEVILNA